MPKLSSARRTFVAMLAATLAAGLLGGTAAARTDSGPGVAQPAGDLAACPTAYRRGKAPNDTQVYKTVQVGQRLVEINVDVYLPRPNGTDPLPALIMLHGGRWDRGCRKHVNVISWELAGEGFITFAIDFRLSCRRSPDPQIKPLCKFHSPAPEEDIGSAVEWVRQNVATLYYPNWNGKVALWGSSSGAQLGYTAAMRAGPEGDPTRPDAVIGFSGPAQLGYLSDGTTQACTITWPEGSNGHCKKIKEYMGFPLSPPPSEVCVDNYASASPRCLVDPGDPPVYIANGVQEGVGLPEALEFHQELVDQGVTTVLCTVGSEDPEDPNRHAHGPELYGKPCNAPLEGTGRQNAMLFLAAHVGS